MKFYKHDIHDWQHGTADLSDGAYRVYHHLIQLIYVHEGPIKLHERGSAGACNQRLTSFRKNLNELLNAGKVTLNDGWIDNERCVNELRDASERNLNISKGVAKALKNKKAKQVQPRNRLEETRLEENRVESKDSCVKRSAYSHEFESFWKVYPRKLAKANAFKAWQKAIKIAPLDAILAGAEAVKRKVDGGAEIRYVKHPASWLNSHGWEDQIDDGPADDWEKVRELADRIDFESGSPSWGEPDAEFFQHRTNGPAIESRVIAAIDHDPNRDG